MPTAALAASLAIAHVVDVLVELPVGRFQRKVLSHPPVAA